MRGTVVTSSEHGRVSVRDGVPDVVGVIGA
jgi:hypothetical protein